MSNKDFIQKSDNTKVNIGTAELPRYKAPFVPDFWKGQQEYAKGNYTDKNAQAYAEKISGKAELTNPEFDLLSGLGIKELWKFIFKPRFKVNLKPNHLELTKERLRNGGFDRLEKQAQIGKPRETGLFTKRENYNNFSPEQRQKLLDMQPDTPNTASFYGKEPSNVAVANQGRQYFSDIFTDAPEHYKQPLAKSSLNSHEYSHVVYQPNWQNKPPEGSYDINLLKNKHYLGIPRSGGLSEQTARGTQLKNLFGLKEGESITPEMWEYAKDLFKHKKLGFDNNMYEWMNAVTDVSKYLKWLNNNTPAVTGVVGGSLYGASQSK